MHDVAQAAEFLAVRDVLSGRRALGSDVRLEESLRREPA
jgi:hypothetical protein